MRIKSLLAASLLLTALFATANGAEHAPALSRAEREKFDQRFYDAITGHLHQLLTPDGKAPELKGTSTIVRTAFAFCLLGEHSGDTRYIAAGRDLADGVLHEMRATKFGVLPADQATEADDAPGGGPPALGEYVADLAYIYRYEDKREADLKYLGNVIDQYPWNEDGWWAADVDAATGKPESPPATPSPIYKNASLILAADILATALKDIDAPLAARLKAKADKCLDRKILPAQKRDGSWPYGLAGKDPADKDIVGYFLLTNRFLMELQHFFVYDTRLESAVERSGVFASKHLAPDPKQPRRGFQVAILLAATGQTAACLKTIDTTLPQLPTGDTGPEGARAIESCALVLQMLR